MITNTQKQAGSAHVVIVIILVTALIGALGFIFWQNFENTKTDDANTTSSEKVEEAPETNQYANWKTYESARNGYSIKYPENWIVINETDQEGPYIRNFDPTNENSKGGYPEGYVNLSVYKAVDDANFKAETGYTVAGFYDALGNTKVGGAAVSYEPKDVKPITFNGISAKSAKSVFTETDEIIFILKDNSLYTISLYPYGISSDPTVKLMLNSFNFL